MPYNEATQQNDATTSAPTAQAAVAPAAKDELITADKFRKMIDMLDAYMAHSHSVTDNYYDNCQCQCGRGSL